MMKIHQGNVCHLIGKIAQIIVIAFMGKIGQTQTIVKENDKNSPEKGKRPSSSATNSQVGSKS